jgi:excisionase family DNA binding protein
MAAPLLTPNDVADLCQISPKTVMRAIRSGRLAAARLGKRGSFRIAPDDVDAWIADSRLTTSPTREGRVRPRGHLQVDDEMDAL